VRQLEQHVFIKSKQQSLSAVLHIPHGERSPGVILCHGFMGNKIGQHRLFVKTARHLADKGFAVLRFDYSGCGDSTGDHIDLSLYHQIMETKDAISFMDNHPSVIKGNLTVLGLSMGACVAALTASGDNRVNRLILWAPVARPFEDLLGIVGYEHMNKVIESGCSDFNGFELGQEFFKSLRTTNPLEEIKSYQGDCFIIHGSGDAEVDSENAKMYYEVLKTGKNRGKHWLRIIPGADHTFSSILWEKQLLESTLEFLETA
jgi:alpha/beta superfamily hydrolase